MNDYPTILGTPCTKEGKNITVRTKAEELGGKIIAAPNAMYATDFPTIEAIQEFVVWLESNDFSHGSILHIGKLFDIRYEK